MKSSDLLDTVREWKEFEEIEDSLSQEFLAYLGEPDIFNPMVKEIWKGLGRRAQLYSKWEYIYDGTNRERRQLKNLRNGDQYKGEWDIDTQKKNGRCYYLWDLGHVFEGFWGADDKPLYGRIIFAEGNVYIGEF